MGKINKTVQYQQNEASLVTVITKLQKSKAEKSAASFSNVVEVLLVG